MSRIRNADEFWTAFQRASGDYDRIFRRRLDEARAWYDHLPVERRPPEFDESLEHHARCYLINAFLAGLNWRLDLSLDEGLPNLLPDAAVRSELSGRRRFLDYLGIEHATNRPLLIVEARRPSSALAVLTTLPDIPTTGPQTPALHGAIPVIETDSAGIFCKDNAGIKAEELQENRHAVCSGIADNDKEMFRRLERKPLEQGRVAVVVTAEEI